MLIQDYAYVEAPASLVTARLCREPRTWLTSLLRDDGEELHTRVGPFEGLPFLSKAVVVELGQCAERGSCTVVPVTWRPDGMERAFPVLDAEIEVTSLLPTMTELNLMGRYDPPLGGVGRRLDQAFIHRLARAGVRAFMRQVAAALSEAAGVEAVLDRSAQAQRFAERARELGYPEGEIRHILATALG